MAVRLARSGADVIVTYRQSRAEAEAVVAEVAAAGRWGAALALDTACVETFAAFEEALRKQLGERFGEQTFDCLVNNAGIDAASPIATATVEDFDRLMAVHLRGPFFLTQRLLPLIADGGRIINVSTGLTRFAIPGYAAYASMKGAVEVFTRYLAKELGPRRITANVVAPGAIETDFTRGAFEAHPGVREYLATQTALGRVGVPEDIGGVVAFLCSEEARWVNAQRLEASGGMFL